MPTLVEELKRAEENEQKQNQLRNAILQFVEQPNIHNLLKKAASKEINASLNNGYNYLKSKGQGSEIKPLGYLFVMDSPDRSKSLLLAHIDLLTDNTSVYIEQYDSNQIPKEHALQTLKTIIGLDEE
jgi:hypothetical protein